ncbi:alpha/beta fold hydrolase, partial [Ameyamaea chiangmaiensis]
MPHTPRRTLLQALGASPLGLVLPAAADQPATQGATRTFVLVHGMFGGGWVWRVVAPMLRRLGHEVHTPTLTGLGERSHLLSAQITIDTHIEDICNVLDTNDLTNVTLVAHSYGGMVATGVADRRRARLRRLIYLDALLPRDGETGFDLLPPGMADLRRRA